LLVRTLAGAKFFGTTVHDNPLMLTRWTDKAFAMRRTREQKQRDAELRDVLGKAIRKMYEDGLVQPLPENLAKLVRNLQCPAGQERSQR
jgi:hypothetical protein